MVGTHLHLAYPPPAHFLLSSAPVSLSPCSLNTRVQRSLRSSLLTICSAWNVLSPNIPVAPPSYPSSLCWNVTLTMRLTLIPRPPFKISTHSSPPALCPSSSPSSSLLLQHLSPADPTWVFIICNFHGLSAPPEYRLLKSLSIFSLVGPKCQDECLAHRRCSLYIRTHVYIHTHIHMYTHTHD